MTKTNFQLSITVSASTEEALAKINQVNKWWAKKVIGKSEKLNDQFTVDFGSTWVDFRITELKPDERVVWTVTDCNLEWIQNKKEWNGTDVIFDITHKNGATQIDFTHNGLIPSCECYEDCKVGWTEHVSESLVKFINGGTGMPQ
jgi:hypothetical protein